MKNSIFQIFVKSMILVVVLFSNSCDSDPVLWDVDSTQQVITQYVDNNPEFSEFSELLKSTGISSLLSVRGPFTLFLPSNEQLQAYYVEKGVGSFQDFSPESQEQLVLNHVVVAEIGSGDIGLGALREVNGIGDYLVSEFDGADIIINKNSKIIDRDVIMSNGVVHLVDKVLDPVSKSVYDVLADDPKFSIFTKGLELVGFKDTLQTISIPFGVKVARTRFTVLAIADSTFMRKGINSVEELVAEFTSSPDSVTYQGNEFYRYMEYHCLAGTYYLSDLNTQLYPVLSYDNNLSVEISDDYKINVDAEGNYTGFYINLSNIPGKNGTIHTINDLLPVFEPRPVQLVWETTDHFDLKQGDYFGKYYKRFFDGQNTFKNVKWDGDYMLYYFKDHDTGKLLNDDCLAMTGWWTVEVKTPKIMKGSYKITSNLWGGHMDYTVYVDGVNSALIKAEDPAETTSWGEFEWTKTTEHTIKIVATSPGGLFWDTVIFTPIN